jgi:hypothetical protein
VSRPPRSARARRRGLLPVAAAALVACSGSADGGPARAGDLLGGTGAPAGIEGRVTIGPLCPVERFPPDPACQPTPETFAAVKVLILDPAGAVLRRVDLDDQGRYAVSLAPGTYLVDTTWRGIGEGGGDPAPGDSGSVGGGTGEPGDDGVVGAPDDPPPPVVIDSSGSGVVPPDPGGSDPGAPGIPVPPDSADPGVPGPDEPPAPCEPVWPTEPAGPDGAVPLGEPTIVDSTGCSAPGFPGDPGEPVPPDTVFPEPPAPGDSTAPPPVPPPFPNDSLAERPPDGEAVPQHLLPVEVELEPGETERLDIDIDTGIR